MSDCPNISVHLLPALIPPGALKGGVAVVVDILRATTVMVHALASGCQAIIPCLEVDEARQVAANLPKGTAILGGERHGLPIEGFDFGNSPGSYTKEVCEGKTLVMTTTNGTKAIHASLEADRVLVATFSNSLATFRALILAGLPIHIVCSGTDGMISLEDTLFAGELAFTIASWCSRDLSHWSEIPLSADCNDSTLIACATAWDTCGLGKKTRSLDRVLKSGKGGRRVTEIGFRDDIKAAARRNQTEIVAELHREPFRIARVD